VSAAQPLYQQRDQTKVMTRHVWESSKEAIDRHRLERVGKRIYKRRKETVERSFADAKQLHGHRYARMRDCKRFNSNACWLPPRRTSRKSPCCSAEWGRIRLLPHSTAC